MENLFPNRALSRRSFLKLAGLAAAGALPITGCSGAGGGGSTLRWVASKPEVLTVFDELAAKYNASQSAVTIDHDGTQISSCRSSSAAHRLTWPATTTTSRRRTTCAARWPTSPTFPRPPPSTPATSRW